MKEREREFPDERFEITDLDRQKFKFLCFVSEFGEHDGSLQVWTRLDYFEIITIDRCWKYCLSLTFGLV